MIGFLIAVKAVELVWGPVYDWVDGRWLGHSLRLSEKKRTALREAARRAELDPSSCDAPLDDADRAIARNELPGFKPDRKITQIVAIQLVCMVIAAWTVSRSPNMNQRTRHADGADLYCLYRGHLDQVRGSRPVNSLRRSSCKGMKRRPRIARQGVKLPAN